MQGWAVPSFCLVRRRLQRDREYIMPFAPALYEVRDEYLNHERPLIQWATRFICEEDVQAFASPTWALRERLHGHGYFCSIALPRHRDIRLLHNIGEIAVEGRAHLDMNRLALRNGA